VASFGIACLHREEAELNVDAARGIVERQRRLIAGKEGETMNDLFGLLTTQPNDVVAPIHAKAMPVILTTPTEIEM
jgi:putative SOS response-associated peptidase YedK